MLEEAFKKHLMSGPDPSLAEGSHRSDIALRLQGITKRYPLVLANDHIDLEVRWGEILALMGENGAGKSTLMKIVYGLVSPDEGSIQVDGQPAKIHSPADAIRLGIGMVHQHFMLVDPLTVTENVVLGAEPGHLFQVDFRRARAEVAQLIAEMGFHLDPDARVEDLPVGLQQRVEILKMLYRKARILILDEPTAVLTPQEAGELFAFLRRFARRGGAVIFISHKLKEVMQLADRVTVIRDGKVVATLPTAQTDAQELARLMVGREVSLTVEKKAATPGEVLLDVRDLWVDIPGRKPAVAGASFQVRAGEIVGLAGVEGNGQTELVEAITGLRSYRGQIRYGAGSLSASARQVRCWGLSHIPEDRNVRGLVLDFPTRDNLILGDHHQKPYTGWLGFFWEEAIDQHARQLVESFDVRPRSISLTARRYSGGNAQKIVVGRELSCGSKVPVAAQPTRGVDVGAIEAIHRRILQARDQGMGVLLVSADLNEVISLSDRILVIHEGHLVGELTPEEATEEQLGLLMGGIQH
ncbi:heme ABC transporter ATP-binding protein [Synechococcus sp. 65AY6A5]|nr:heme ABC transporter ATP-binding protein [Synechococcus sp. 65AY6A5]